MNKHTVGLLENHFETAFSAPDGLKKLRELILTLAMQGKLVPRDPSEQPVGELLKEIEAEKQRLVKEGKKKKSKPLSPVTEQERPCALPKAWRWVRFGEIAQHNSGKTLDGGRNTGVPRRYITTSNVYWGEFQLNNVREMLIREDELDKCSARKGDLLICEGGEAGRAAVWELPEEICFQNHVHRARLYRGVNQYFAFRFFEKINASGEISNYRKGVGISNMSSKALASIAFPLPPSLEQHRIVAKIDELMARCDELEKLRTAQQGACLAVHAAAIKQLLNIAEPGQHQRAHAFLAEHFGELYTVKENVAELRKAILQLAVMGKLVPQSPVDPPASELLQEIEAERQRLVEEGKIRKMAPLPPVTEEEKPYALPQGWEWVRLGELGITQTGTTPPSNDRENYGDYIPFIGPGDIKNNGIDCSGNGLSERGLLRGRLIDKGSVLMVCIGGSIGKHAIAEQNISCNQQINTLTPYNHASGKYLFYIMASAYFQSAVNSRAGGSATPIINKKKWSGIPVPFASVSEQCRIVSRIDQLMDLCDALDQQIDSATTKQAQLLGAVMAQL
jgi:type I restriction enzyme S subunit